MLLFAASMAILLPLVLLVVFKLPAKYGMAISCVVVSLLAVFAWGVSWPVIGASALQAVHRAANIGLILVGAVTLLYTVQCTGAMERIKYGFHAISADMRVQAVLVGFVFISLIEGAAGFGTPAMVIAPLLMALGFKPLAAATLSLLGDTIAVTFGAVGTPLLVGLENVPGYSLELAQAVGAQVATFDLVIGTLAPLVMVAVLVYVFGGKRQKRWQEVTELAPWSLVVGLVYSLTAFTAVRLIGPEFTAIAGSLVALLVAMVTAKYGILLPKKAWRHHANEDIVEGEVKKETLRDISLFKAWFPYVAIVLLLLLTRAVPAIKQAATTWLDVSWRSVLGFESINSTWQLLYSPGTILLMAALIATLLQAKSIRPMLGALRQTGSTLLTAMMALVPTLILVQVFSNSGINDSGLASMPIYIGQVLAGVFGDAWVAAAPLLAAAGAFIAGSATVSTLTLAAMQDGIALAIGLPQDIILAVHMIGAAAGNVVAIHNVVAVAAVVGLAHREGHIMRKTILVVAGYLVLAAILGAVAIALT